MEINSRYQSYSDSYTFLKPNEAEIKLKSLGIDPNYSNNAGDNALHLACKKNNFEAVKLLISYGIDPSVGNKKNYIPLHFAVKKGFVDIADHLLKNTPETLFTSAWDDKVGHISPFSLVSKSKNLEMLLLFSHYKKDLIEDIKDIVAYDYGLGWNDFEDNDKNTAYYFSVYMIYNSFKDGWFEGAQYLQEKHPEIFLDQDLFIFNKNLLHLACAAGNLDCVRFLLEEKGYDVNKVNQSEMKLAQRTIYESDYWSNSDWSAWAEAPCSGGGNIGVVRAGHSEIQLDPIASPLTVVKTLHPRNTALIEYLEQQGGKTFFQASDNDKSLAAFYGKN
ncbi:MAG: hypothetical protein S4CHLAM7_05730 [Chlamydiae bacterium]|nr:hypothetical protein [Chlamydiota bacterium]